MRGRATGRASRRSSRRRRTLRRRPRRRPMPRSTSSGWRSWWRRIRFRGSSLTMPGTSAMRPRSGPSRRGSGWRCCRRARALEDLNAAEARYKQAQAAAVLARKGFRKEDIEAARGRLAEAQGRVAELEARLREAELKAPADAVVEVVSVRPGDLVPAGRIVITMLESSQLWVKVYVPETDLARVHVGQRAAVHVDGIRRAGVRRGTWARSRRRRSSCRATCRPRAIASTRYLVSRCTWTIRSRF